VFGAAELYKRRCSAMPVFQFLGELKATFLLLTACHHFAQLSLALPLSPLLPCGLEVLEEVAPRQGVQEKRGRGFSSVWLLLFLAGMLLGQL
jgi:hypothetical protein